MKRKAFLASCLSPLALLVSSRAKGDNTPEAPKSPEISKEQPTVVIFSDNGEGILGSCYSATFTNTGQKAGIVAGFRIEPGETLSLLAYGGIHYDAHGTQFLIRHYS